MPGPDPMELVKADLGGADILFAVLGVATAWGFVMRKTQEDRARASRSVDAAADDDAEA